MKINYNVSAMIANSALRKNDNALSTSLERLSSGWKINHAKDNASGLAMAKRMNAQIRSLEVANQNANDGISVVEIAEGALIEIEEMVQRMNELAVKACNGTMSDDDRVYIDDEIKQLKNEIERIANTTMYNGEVLLDGSYDVKGYAKMADGTDSNMKVTTYGDAVRTGQYEISNLTTHFDTDGNVVIDNIAFSGEFPAGITYETKKDAIYLTGPNEFTMELQVTNDQVYNNDDIVLDITGLGSMGVQIGTGKGQQLDVRIATVSLRTLGLEDLDCSTYDNSMTFLAQMDATLSYINQARSRLGAYEQRFEHTISTLDVSEENMTGAYSRIMDLDMAEEMTTYSTEQVLVQAGTSMLAQANERPSSVLQLLQK